MKRGGFVEAVTAAIGRGSDCWEARYYCDSHFDQRKLEVYMQSRAVALGPEWETLQRCVTDMELRRMRRERRST